MTATTLPAKIVSTSTLLRSSIPATVRITSDGGQILINAETAEVRTSPKMEGKRTCLRVRNEIKCPHANTRLVGLDAPKR
jgi:hypothetical protein